MNNNTRTSLTKYLSSRNIKKSIGISKLMEAGYIKNTTTPTLKGKVMGCCTQKLYGIDYLSIDIKKLDKFFNIENKKIKKEVKKTNIQVNKHKQQNKNDNTIYNTNDTSIKEDIDTYHNYNIRSKFPAKFRTQDGHFVRSKAEQLIDNYLYNNKIVHTYEKKLPTKESLYTDFFIPLGDQVYIEYWGYENDPKYIERKKKKLEIYKKYNFNLIELTDEDIRSLDDILPEKLLKYNITLY